MKELMEHKNCTIQLAEESDSKLVYTILSPAVIKATSANSKLRQSKKLNSFIRYSINNKTAILLLVDGKPIGACLYEARKINTIIHINILKKYRKISTTSVLGNYILNIVCKDEEVYFSNYNRSFKAIAELKDGVYKCKQSFRDSLKRWM